MANKKHLRITFRLENGEKVTVKAAADLTSISMSKICRMGGVALSELIIKNKGKLKFPIRFK